MYQYTIKKRGNKNSMTVNERLRYVRKRLLCLTQAELASDMGLTSNTIGVIETRTRNITEQTLKHFCVRYSINEEWMRTGNGKIFAEQNTLIEGENNGLQRRTKESC